MEEEAQEPRHYPSPNSCCPVPFLAASPSPGAAPAVDEIPDHDLRLLRNSHSALDIPWDSCVTEALNGDEDDEEQPARGDGRCKSHLKRARLKGWCTGKSTSRFFCGAMCNPLLTSRLALVGLLAILFTVMTVLTWLFTSTNVEDSVSSLGTAFRHELLVHTQQSVGSIFQGNNASTLSLARFLSSSLIKGSFSSFLTLEDQVGPALFLAYSVLPGKSQVSYFGKNGLFISYFTDSKGSAILYANTSYLYSVSDSNGSKPVEIPWRADENITLSRPWYHWYRQSVDTLTGLPVGEATITGALPYWCLDSFNSTLQGQQGVANRNFFLDESENALFLSLAPVRQRSAEEPVGAVAIGVSLENFQNVLQKFDLQGAHVYLTTEDGHLVAQTGVPLSSNGRDLGILLFPLATISNNAIVAGAAKYLAKEFSNISSLSTEPFTASDVDIQGTSYIIDTSPFHLGGATLVCVVIIPRQSIWGSMDKRNHKTLAVLLTLAACVGLVGCFFVVLLMKGLRNEMHLRAALIQQLEATKRAETKSSHKSLVFANMSHDLRTPLAAILGLIDLCLCEASESSELEANLLQMKSCATNLLGILNSILDMSKIEAGKLQLQETHFDLVGALEEVVEIFSVVGLKKGVEVVLDLSDGSVEKVAWVRGDCGRVKQIMANLLSNGVKFTTEGHVVLRAWVKPDSSGISQPHLGWKQKLASCSWNQLWRSHLRDKEACKLVQVFDEQDNDNGYVEIEFEVDDTGRGIPKERWKAVFENFVQVEASVPRSYDGTGLGLGIVRSLVRLMGGEIKIIDKDEPGEPGTRFRFNLIFKCNKQLPVGKANHSHLQDIDLKDGASVQSMFGMNSESAVPVYHLGSSEAPYVNQSKEDAGCDSPPIAEGIHVLLAMQGQAGKKVVRKWMEKRGLQVWEIGQWEEFAATIEKIKQEIFFESFSDSERFDLISPESHLGDLWVEDLEMKGIPFNTSCGGNSLQRLSTPDCGSNNAHLVQKVNLNRTRACLLLVIDIAMVTESLDTLYLDLESNFPEKDHAAIFKVVWLVTANTPSADLQDLRRGTVPCDLILHKPLHVSRLQSIWVLLQGLIGNKEQNLYDVRLTPLSSRLSENREIGSADSLYKSLSCMSTFQEEAQGHASLITSSSFRRQSLNDTDQNVSCLVVTSTDRATMEPHVGLQIAADDVHQQVDKPKFLGGSNIHRWFPPQSLEQLPFNTIPEKILLPKGKSREDEIMGPQHSLSDMHILVAEDNPVLQRLTKTMLVRLGATVECVDNGADAARLVTEKLYRSKILLSSDDDGADSSKNISEEELIGGKRQPFDIVLMDCEMPVLDGYEATQRIREEESRYGVRTPVIALTAHAMAQDEKKCIEAGMDFYLTKPLATKALLSVVAKLTPGRNLDIG